MTKQCYSVYMILNLILFIFLIGKHWFNNRLDVLDVDTETIFEHVVDDEINSNMLIKNHMTVPVVMPFLYGLLFELKVWF